MKMAFNAVTRYYLDSVTCFKISRIYIFHVQTQSIMWNNKRSTFDPYPFGWDWLQSLWTVWRNLEWVLVDPGWHNGAKLERRRACTHLRKAMLPCGASMCACGSMNEEALHLILGCSLFQGQSCKLHGKASPDVDKVKHTEKSRESEALVLKG